MVTSRDWGGGGDGDFDLNDRMKGRTCLWAPSLQARPRDLEWWGQTIGRWQLLSTSLLSYPLLAVFVLLRALNFSDDGAFETIVKHTSMLAQRRLSLDIITAVQSPGVATAIAHQLWPAHKRTCRTLPPMLASFLCLLGAAAFAF